MIEPIDLMLPSRMRNFEEVFSRFDNVIAEPKIDGIRIQAHIDGDIIRIFSRAKNEVTILPILHSELAKCSLTKNAIFDGELVVTEGTKIASFEKLMKVYKNGKLTSNLKPAIILFDLIDFDENEAFTMPFMDRKSYLHELIQENDYISITPSKELDNELDAEQVYRNCLKKGFEGIVFKNGTAQYTFGRSADIVKFKPLNFIDLCITQKGFYPTGGYKYMLSNDKGNVCEVRDYRNFLKGAFVEVAFEKQFGSGKLKFPRIIRVREPK